LEGAARSEPRKWFVFHCCYGHGINEDLPDDHPLKMVIKTHPPTGYPQVYFFDPDRHLLEWNAATID
jgi:hypothetical protein